MRGRVIVLVSVPALALISLAGASPASATVSCNFASATAAITADAAGNNAILGRDNSIADNIDVSGSQCGGAATVNNTDTITFTDSSGSNTKLTVFLGLGPFAPGVTDETGGSDEIEMTASFGSGGNEFDVLEVDGCSGAPCSTANDNVVWGSGGINLNANEAPTVDADLTATGVESDQALGGPGNDTLSADGGFGTGVVSSVPVQFFGQGGMDFLTGGTAGDALDGAEENDVIVGGQGDDNISPGLGDDQLDGQAGTADVVNFAGAASGVSVDLTQGGAQDTGEGSDLILGAESMFGSEFDDPLLKGSDVANNIQGIDGDDVIRGLDGDDSLTGGTGDDVIEGGPDDVVGDTISGGDGGDTADYSTGAAAVEVDLAASGAQQTGGGGLDTLSDVESLAGSAFSDRLKGDGGANTIKGRAGKDRLKGRAGKDTIKAGGGPDLTLTRDGAKDKVRCGGGHDVAKADAKDALKGCEVKKLG